MNRKGWLYKVEGGKVGKCPQPTKACLHEHHFFLASAGHRLQETFNLTYHVGEEGHVARCPLPASCKWGPHFPGRREAVAHHRRERGWDFSGPYRPVAHPYVSLLEEEFSSFIGLLGFKQVVNSRQVIFPHEVDVYLPTREVAFEFNGDHWHSAEVLETRYNLTPAAYHGRKVVRCGEQGIKLAFVWEQNWLQNWGTVADAAADFIQFKRLSPLLTQTVKALSPRETHHEVLHRRDLLRQRAKVEGRILRALPKGEGRSKGKAA